MRGVSSVKNFCGGSTFMSLPFVGIGRRGVSDNERCSCADLVCSLGGRNVLNQRRRVTFSVPTRPARPLYAIICSTIFSQQYCRTIRPNFPDSQDILQKLVASEKHLGKPEIPERFHEKFGNLKNDSLKICDMTYLISTKRAHLLATKSFLLRQQLGYR